jgi:hypothetical protein
VSEIEFSAGMFLSLVLDDLPNLTQIISMFLQTPSHYLYLFSRLLQNTKSRTSMCFANALGLTDDTKIFQRTAVCFSCAPFPQRTFFRIRAVPERSSIHPYAKNTLLKFLCASKAITGMVRVFSGPDHPLNLAKNVCIFLETASLDLHVFSRSSSKRQSQSSYVLSVLKFPKDTKIFHRYTQCLSPRLSRTSGSSK